MSLQSLVYLFTVQPFQLLLTLISGIFHLLLSLTTRNKQKPRSASQSRQMKTDELTGGGGNLYEEYCILVEQCLSLNVLPPCNNYSSNGGTFNSTRAWIDGKKWEFTVCRNSNSHQHTLRLCLAEMNLEYANVCAEIIFWQWHRGKHIYILQKFLKCFQQPNSSIQFQMNGTNANALPSDGYFNVLIRLLEKQAKRSPVFPTFGDAENVKLIVGPESFLVSQHYLMSISPVFQKMFSTEMRERAQREVVLEETSPEEFKAFLEAISPKQIHPNPHNVHELLKLADRFQCELLLNRCEEHLVNCVEIPIIERLFCAEFYRLEKLKNHILKSLTGPGLRDFYEENQSELNVLSKDLLIQLTSRICTRSTALLSATIAKET